MKSVYVVTIKVKGRTYKTSVTCDDGEIKTKISELISVEDGEIIGVDNVGDK